MSVIGLARDQETAVKATERPGPLRIVHVVLSLDCGGLERLVVALVQKGIVRGQEITVVCLERLGTLAPEVEGLGGRVVCLNKRPGIRLRTVRRLKSLLAELQPHVVHTHQIGALFYAGLAARRADVPVVVHTEHGKTYAGRWRTRLLGRFAGRLAGRFICVSRDIAEEVLNYRIVPRRKVVVVPNGIDAAPFRGHNNSEALLRTLNIPAEAPVLGTVGRLTEIKRQDLLIHAFAKLRDLHPAAHLLLVGDGPAKEDLCRMAASLGIVEYVHFTGYQAQPEQYLELMNAFVLTSRSEGMPVTVLEAWAAGLPVVASRVGGLPELIDEGKTGFLFPLENETELVRILDSLLRDNVLARQIGLAGREKVVALFSLGQMEEDYQRHYVELLAEKGVMA
jgi:glycosyltransferase involved in cell wall biosynthesis